ncbi:MAG: phage major capsid protein [Lactobacillus sp.]|nr:phage major capsid protein [Lactobacillus sp.]
MNDTIFIKDNLKGSVPVEIASEVIKNIVTQSTAFSVCKHIPMTSDTKVLPMLSDTGSAYWVDEGESIGTSVHGWEYPELEAKKLAVIIPVTKEKLQDSVLNVMSEIQQGISDAFSRAIDLAVFFGVNSPFETNIFEEANKQKVNRVDGENLDISISNTIAKIEANDLNPNAMIGAVSLKNELRLLRDTNGNAVQVPGGASGSMIYNLPIYYPTTRAFDSTKAQLLVGDYSRAIIGTRNDISYEILDQATVGGVNLAEKDLLAIKCTLRFAFNVVDSKAFSALIPKEA